VIAISSERKKKGSFREGGVVGAVEGRRVPVTLLSGREIRNG